VSDLAAARTRLGARQQEVLAKLLAGEVPAGFDEVTTRSAAAQLVDKRRLEALEACPDLSALSDFASLFTAWARSAPRVGCGHDDVLAFLDATQHRRQVRWWRAEQQVLARRRSIAWIRRRGRREVLLGVGSTLWRLAWRPERPDQHPTIDPREHREDER
jgi:hypothetical protein